MSDTDMAASRLSADSCRGRRLPATILAAVHRACDSRQLDVAARLLRLGEEVIAGETDLRRRRTDLWALIAAYERLWHLRHGDGGTT